MARGPLASPPPAGTNRRPASATLLEQDKHSSFRVLRSVRRLLARADESKRRGNVTVIPKRARIYPPSPITHMQRS